MIHQGWKMRRTTAEAYHAGTSPDEQEDAYFWRDGAGSLSEIWDVLIERDERGYIGLVGNWPHEVWVTPETPIYYSPPERY
jgi:hypothetical protein